MIVAYRSAHRDLILGLSTAYGDNTHELAGFLSYGHAYGLLQHDFIRERIWPRSGWTDFDPAQETVSLPAKSGPEIAVTVLCRKR